MRGGRAQKENIIYAQQLRAITNRPYIATNTNAKQLHRQTNRQRDTAPTTQKTIKKAPP